MTGESTAPRSVPAVDSTANTSIEQVVGNKNDTHNGTSIKAMLHKLDEHAHKSSKVWPTLANGVVVTAGAAWVLGAFAEIAAVNDIAVDFDIHHISVEALSANEVYEIVLYAATVEIARVRVTKNANLDGTMNVPVQCPIQPANTQIQA
ncbi:hypothetical protein LCGC14_1491540, partial [marine sediment metagenome]